MISVRSHTSESVAAVERYLRRGRWHGRVRLRAPISIRTGDVTAVLARALSAAPSTGLFYLVSTDDVAIGLEFTADTSEAAAYVATLIGPPLARLLDALETVAVHEDDLLDGYSVAWLRIPELYFEALWLEHAHARPWGIVLSARADLATGELVDPDVIVDALLPIVEKRLEFFAAVGWKKMEATP